MITLTERAADHVRELLDREEEVSELFLRVYVTPGGCSGFNYGLALDDEAGEDDRVYERHGVQVVVDEQSLPLLQGVEIDYVEGITGRGFALSNPNAMKTCACGQSFQAQQDEGVPEPCD